VEAADDICYSIIDLEDGCSLGLVTLDDTIALLAAILKDDFKPEKLAKIVSRAEKIGALRALVIKKLVDELSQIFLDNEQDILEGSFDKALVDECTSKHALKEIINESVEKIYQARQVVEIEAAGHEVLPGLLEEFIIAGDHAMNGSDSRKYQNLQKLLPPEAVTQIVEHNDTYTMLRLIIDFVSGLTDRHALSLFRKIKGISIH
jgi:dGTPase